MADVKKIATRDSYGNTLKELAAEGHDDLVVLDADLAAATKTGMFQKAYPDRHFDCGIAEGNAANMTCISASSTSWKSILLPSIRRERSMCRLPRPCGMNIRSRAN